MSRIPIKRWDVIDSSLSREKFKVFVCTIIHQVIKLQLSWVCALPKRNHGKLSSPAHCVHHVQYTTLWKVTYESLNIYTVTVRLVNLWICSEIFYLSFYPQTPSVFWYLIYEFILCSHTMHAIRENKMNKQWPYTKGSKP